MVSVIFYKNDLPTIEGMERVKHVLARIAALSLMLGAYTPQSDIFEAITPSPNHPVVEIFGLEPELFCIANYTNYTNCTNNDKSSSHISGAHLDLSGEQRSIFDNDGASF